MRDVSGVRSAVRSEPSRARAEPRTWVIVGVAILGGYLVVIDNTVLGVALPDVARDLGGDAAKRADWVITANLIASAITLPAVAWLVSRWGARPTYLASLALFTGASALCAMAPNMELLIATRGLQGLGGAAIMPVGMAMMFQSVSPQKRGTVTGIWGICIMGAPTLAPPLGGWVVAEVGWRWVFWSYLPLGVLAIATAAILLPDQPREERRRLDALGWVFATYAVVAIVVGARQTSHWGIASMQTAVLASTALLAGGAFVVRCLRREHPLIEVRMFAVPAFAVSVVIISFVHVAHFSRLVFLPIELQVVRGLDAERVGLLLAPAAVGMAIVLPFAGWVTDRIGPKLPVTVGLAMLAVGTWRLGQASVSTAEGILVVDLVVAGAGTGLVFTPNLVAAMNALPQRFVPHASSVNQLNRQISGAVATAALGAFVAGRLGEVAPDLARTSQTTAEAQVAYNGVFTIGAFAVLVSLLLAFSLPGRRRSAALRHDRLIEHQQALAG